MIEQSKMENCTVKKNIDENSFLKKIKSLSLSLSLSDYDTERPVPAIQKLARPVEKM